MSRKVKIAMILVIDTGLIVVANLLSYFFMNSFSMTSSRTVVISCLSQIVLYLLFGSYFKVFNRITRYTSLNSVIAISLAVTCSSAVEIVSLGLFHAEKTAIGHALVSYFMTLLLIVTSRLFWRVLISYQNKSHVDRSNCPNALIIGAGEGGQLFYDSIQRKLSSVKLTFKGFVDDDPNKANTIISGLKVVGTIDELPELIEAYDIDVLTVAIPSMTPHEYEHLLDVIKDSEVMVYSIPSIEELAVGSVAVTKLREVDVIDLLGRDEVKLDMSVISEQIENKTILVTGAGGSIGSEICRQLIEFSPKRLILLGHGENSIYLILKELNQHFSSNQTEFIPVIADIRDAKRMDEVMCEYEPSIVYHAAAHKHVPLMEYNPREALKNNIYGTKNVAEAALANNVESFVMVSTDKAVNPPNVMGASKRVAEMIVTGLNGKGRTKFSAVRFGNVLGSRGSVVPLFKEQIAAGGPVTVTDFEMTRYFMTIPEASRLVIQSGALAQGGEIFILDMGEPVKIVDLAKKVILLSGYTEEEIGIVESGIRPGEKLYEELLVDKEKSEDRVYDKIFVGNVKGFTFDEVMTRVESLSNNDEELAKELIEFANLSSEG